MNDCWRQGNDHGCSGNAVLLDLQLRTTAATVLYIFAVFCRIRQLQATPYLLLAVTTHLPLSWTMAPPYLLLVFGAVPALIV
jgi:hypothetical protein